MALVILRVLLTEAIRVFISFNEGIRYVLKGGASASHTVVRRNKASLKCSNFLELSRNVGHYRFEYATSLVVQSATCQEINGGLVG